MEIDIYIDEEKDRGFLGFLVTTHHLDLQEKLHSVRNKEENYKPEVKFVKLNNTSIKIALPWLNIFNHHSQSKFYYRKWDGSITQKRNKVNQFIGQIKQKYHSSKIIIFFDFDSQHENFGLIQQVKVNSRVQRCYQMNSKVCDMLQLCDLLLSVAVNSGSLVVNKAVYIKLQSRFNKGDTLKKKELKKFFLYYAIKKERQFKKIKNKVV